MAKFKFRLKVQALELEVEGKRQDIPLITAAVNRQFASLVEPAEVIADAPKQIRNGAGAIDVDTGGTSRRGSSRRRTGARTSGDSAAPVEFRHDSAKFGSPLQGWTVTEKCIWLLYVLQTSTSTREYTAAQLVATCNQQFKAAGKLHPPNVTRELPKAKVLVPAPIGEDKSLWYLTAEGERQAKELVTRALNAPNS